MVGWEGEGENKAYFYDFLFIIMFVIIGFYFIFTPMKTTNTQFVIW